MGPTKRPMRDLVTNGVPRAQLGMWISYHIIIGIRGGLEREVGVVMQYSRVGTWHLASILMEEKALMGIIVHHLVSC